MTMTQLLLLIISASGVIICGLTGLVITLLLKRMDNITAQLHEMTKAINAFVRREDCTASMGDHCTQLSDLRKGFEENKSAIRQISNELKRHHGIEIIYNG